MKIADFQLDEAVVVGPDPVWETSATPAMTSSLCDRFAAQVLEHPGRVAVADEAGALTYAQLDDLSRQIAGFIAQRDYAPETAVAVMCGRNCRFVAAALGVLRSGNVYVPVDASLPIKRRQHILNASSTPLVIVDRVHAGAAEGLSHACLGVRHLLCLDTARFEDAIEAPGALMNLQLWEHVTTASEDGSWKSYFDEAPLGAAILQDMANNVVAKTRQCQKHNHILDIGSGAGTVARALMNTCTQYSAVDIARNELDRLEALAQTEEVAITTHQMEAIDIRLLPHEAYDLITLNSVVENFPGYNYLRAVLNHAVDKLQDGGTLFLGCVWDADKRAHFLADLTTYAEQTGDETGLIRLENGQELFVSKDFFTDWQSQLDVPVQLTFSTPEISAQELSAYRFDVTIRRLGDADPTSMSASVVTSDHTLRPLPRRFGLDHLPSVADAVSSPIAQDQVAYIIFTSGSTGVPKGVEVEHHSLLNLVDALHSTVYAPVWGEDRISVALLASFSFDASLQQIFSAILGGHTLQIVSDECRKDLAALHDFSQSREIDLCDGTPSLFSLLIDYWAEHNIHASPKAFILGGEALQSDHVRRFFSIPAHEDCHIFNAYGPTECCVDVTLYHMTAATYGDYAVPPIGSPIVNIQITVRAKDGRVMAEGLPGEIWIGGAGVARGYLNDPVATEAGFVHMDGQRWYRTGDMGRCHDGVFFFAGREDSQVKINGYRVELGEIEAALNAAPAVKQAVVTVGDYAKVGPLAVVAYVVPTTTLDPARLRRYLAGQIPAYAIPHFFVSLAQLPLTPSGKVDRKGLPSPLAEAYQSEFVGRPLQGETESKLAQIWCRLLGRPVRDAETCFFEIGGHSVLGIRLISLIEQEFGRRLSLSTLFKASTIAELAEELAADEVSPDDYSPVIPLTSGTGKAPMFLFHPVGGSVFCYRFLADALAGDHPIYAVEAPGYNVGWSQMLCVEDIAARYLDEMLATTSYPEEIIFAGWSFGGLVAFEAARQFLAQGGRVGGLILLDTTADNTVAKKLIQKDEAAMLATLFSEQLPVVEQDFRDRSGNDRLEFLIALGMEHNLLPTGFDVAQMRELLQIYHGNALAAARYDASPLMVDALLIRPVQMTQSAMTNVEDPVLGWRNYLRGEISVKWVNGTHETMLMENRVAETADHIRAYLLRGRQL